MPEYTYTFEATVTVSVWSERVPDPVALVGRWQRRINRGDERLDGDELFLVLPDSLPEPTVYDPDVEG